MILRTGLAASRVTLRSFPKADVAQIAQFQRERLDFDRLRTDFLLRLIKQYLNNIGYLLLGIPPTAIALIQNNDPPTAAKRTFPDADGAEHNQPPGHPTTTP